MMICNKYDHQRSFRDKRLMIAQFAQSYTFPISMLCYGHYKKDHTRKFFGNLFFPAVPSYPRKF